MKLLVISDTHGNLEKAFQVYEQLSGVDVLIHLGDCQRDAQELKRRLGVDIISVRGNMDRAYGPNEFTVFPTECGKLYLSHGHMENVKMSYQNILYRAEEEGCVAALFGHTHKPLFAEVEGLYLVNPGSLSLPATGGPGTYALLTTSPEGLEGAIWPLDSDRPLFGSSRSGQPANTREASERTTTPSEVNQAPVLESPGKKSSSKASRVQGGYLRKLLNYSDRF
ncbi:metallophosphoesterase [Aminipila butyrica]|uniref:Phosphoesterase n=1 Tax=Aminipila butyrica TaxID=433296 RepID=A0A858BVJ7_9FIRM|nr:metallophosphoesterase [Aminipila butyrica]QIB69085.1 metallophosphoesterase [Aminipila butyrica]